MNSLISSLNVLNPETSPNAALVARLNELIASFKPPTPGVLFAGHHISKAPLYYDFYVMVGYMERNPDSINAPNQTVIFQPFILPGNKTMPMAKQWIDGREEEYTRPYHDVWDQIAYETVVGELGVRMKRPTHYIQQTARGRVATFTTDFTAKSPSTAVKLLMSVLDIDFGIV